jgi:hypothetical protein
VSKSQRTKGAVFEREVAAYFTTLFGRKITRVLGQARDGGGDIDLGGIQVECKRRQSMKVVYGWWRQANASAAPTGSLPALVLHADGEESLFVCRLADLPAMAGRIERERLLS